MKTFLSSLFAGALLVSSAFAQAPVAKNMTLRSQFTFPGLQLSNIGGYVDTAGNEYALVGTSAGMSIVDVTDPDNVFLVKNIPGPNSIWREVKTWDKYAYVTTEGGNVGLTVVDLSNLPDTVVPYHQWQPTVQLNGGTQTLSTIHALHIDDGFVYLYGSNGSNNTFGGIEGMVIADLADPWNPVVAGVYNDAYVHDGYVRNDTAWACRIYDGDFAVIDVSNPANPVVLAQQNTPSNFTHNSWLSDNSKYLFTTDEVDNSYLAVYDVENISNIVEVDRIFSQNPGEQSVVHNTHILNDFAVTSWYKDGVVITDGHRPQNLVHVGWYDTSPLAGPGMDGCWGVYPFLPSGTIVASDMQEGLFVLTPNYVRACYLEGTVMDSTCNQAMSGVAITINGINVTGNTDIDGVFNMGTPDAGTYSVTFSKPGYTSVTINNVVLSNAAVTNLYINMSPSVSINLTGQILDQGGTTGMQGVSVILSNAVTSFNWVTDSNGEFLQCGVVPGTYDFVFGKWGYLTSCSSTQISSSSLSGTLTPGYYDDFSFGNGWVVNSTASSGFWTRSIPVGTFGGTIPSNPGTDASGDCRDFAFVTGNDGSSVSVDDVDNGYTELVSPPMDLSSYQGPKFLYSRWFANSGGSGGPNDTLIISLTNGTDEYIIEKVHNATPANGTWVPQEFLWAGQIPLTSNMRIKVRVTDYNPGHLVEGGFDYFRVQETAFIGSGEKPAPPRLMIYPNPAREQLFVTVEEGTINAVVVRDLSGRQAMVGFGVNGKTMELDLNGLAAGLYTLSVEDSKGNLYTEKFQKLQVK